MEPEPNDFPYTQSMQEEYDELLVLKNALDDGVLSKPQPEKMADEFFGSVWQYTQVCGTISCLFVQAHH